MSKIETLHSKNNTFQRLEVLKRNRQKRYQYQEFIIEGVRSFSQAIANGWDFVSVAYCKQRPLSDWARKTIANCKATTRLEMSFELLQELSDKEETSELLAVVKMKPDDLSRISLEPSDLVLVFDRPNNPGNLGSSIRSVDALGAKAVVVTGHATDLYHAHTIRGSMGSFFSIPVIRLPSHTELLAWVEQQRQRLKDLVLIGTSEKGDKFLSESDLTRSCILLMGNETFGLSQNYQAICQEMLKIPMQGTASSLNVSCATSICLYERIEQVRRKKLM